ncbi:MAG: alpha/beta hydrolase [Bacteroidia bacterium]|nr:alpha/beta hydrolase [Bacteroidia bacterium]
MEIQEQSYKNVGYLFSSKPESKLPPIILVHGAYNNGFLWKQNFMPYFVSKGHPVYSIHLKDQLTVKKFKTLFSYSLSAFVEHLSIIVEKAGEKPILIGHSMGGLVVQKYLSTYPGKALGACLLASLPVFGMKNTVLNMLLDPVDFMKYTVLTLAPELTGAGKPPKGLLSKKSATPENLHQFQYSLQRESGVALTNCLNPKINVENVKKTPLLIYGASLDRLALPADVIKMGEIYGQPAKIFHERGHFLMMEPEWKEIADSMETFIPMPTSRLEP